MKIAVAIIASMIGAAIASAFGIGWYQAAPISFFHSIAGISLYMAIDDWNRRDVI
jgi:hypothetical protein